MAEHHLETCSAIFPRRKPWGQSPPHGEQGIRYFDTAPFYGAGLSEIRMGKVLSNHNRDDYVLSTKVGRMILNEVETGQRQFGEKGGLFEHGRPNKIVYDYTEAGTKKSIEDSLKRLGVDRLDFVWVHDIAQDFHGDACSPRGAVIVVTNASSENSRRERR